MTMHIADISLVQLLLVISSPDHMQGRVIGIVIDPIIVEWHEHSLIDRLFQRDLVRDIVITDLIDTPAVHSLRRRC